MQQIKARISFIAILSNIWILLLVDEVLFTLMSSFFMWVLEKKI